MSARTPTKTSLLLALVMVVPMLATAVGAQLPAPVSPNQEAEIKASIDFRAPYGQWEDRVEVSTFYLHSANPASQPGPGTAGTFDTARPGLGGTKAGVTAVIGPDPFDDGPFCPAPSNRATYVPTLDPDNRVEGPVNLYEMTGLVYSDAPPGEVQVKMEVYHLRDGQPMACGSASLTKIAEILLNAAGGAGGSTGTFTAGAVVPWTGTVDLTNFDPDVPQGRVNNWGVDGYPLQTNDRLVISIRLHLLTDPFGLQHGTTHRIFLDGSAQQSQLRITADSARVNLWTQNSFKEVTSSFPGGVGSSTEERRVKFHAVVANQFGLLNCDNQKDGSGRHDPNRPHWVCPGDNFNEDSVRFRVRDMNPSHRTSVDPSWDKPWQYNQYVPVDQTMGIRGDPGRDDTLVRCCRTTNVEIDPIVYDEYGFQESRGVTILTHTFVWGPDFPPGRYQIEFHESDRNWKVYTTFDIGNTGFSFEFAPGEHEVSQDGLIARHLVKTNEPTEYIVRVTNNGGASDTYGLSVPTPGFGWLAQVQPNTVTIAPGGYHDFTLTVTPPSTGLAGDVKVVFVSAVSIADNTVKTLTTETTLTGQEKLGVDLIPTLGAVRTRPDRTESLPVIMRNTGTVQGDFVLTAEGVPPGWQVDLTPAFAHVLAASREDILVQIHAPREAVPPLNPSAECGLPKAEDNHPGCTWSLLLQAQHVVDNLVQDTLEIPVSVILVDGLLVTPLNRTVHMHDVAGDRFSCGTNNQIDPADCPGYRSGGAVFLQGFEEERTHADTDFDDTALFRLQIDNTGDRPDTFVIFASWVAPDNCDPDLIALDEDQGDCPAPKGDNDDAYGDTDWSDCDTEADPGNRRDGIPDGWRFRVIDGGDNAAVEKHVDPLGRFDGFVTTIPTTPQHGDAYRPHPTAPFGGEWRVGELRLPPHEAQDVYFELGWVIPQGFTPNDRGCDNNEEDSYRGAGHGGQRGDADDNCRIVVLLFGCGNRPSPEARLRVTVRSENDPSIRHVETLHAVLDPVLDMTNEQDTTHGSPVDNQGRVRGAVHDVHLELGLGEEDFKQANIFDPDNALNFTGARYRMRATNVGNEHDSIVIRVDQGRNGWTHQVIDIGVQMDLQPIPSTLTEYPAKAGGPWTEFTRDKRTCTEPMQNRLEFTCRNLGVGDTVEFTVWALPPMDARVGQRDILSVSATTTGLQEDFALFENETADLVFGKTLEVETRVRGSYFFELEDLADERRTYPGQSIAFPFSIHNLGQEDDTYELTIVESESSWGARFGTPPRVRVPAGFSFHGFLAATVPVDWSTGSEDTRIEEHFRIKVRSTLSEPGSQQTEVMDFFAVVEERPSYTVASEALTVRSGDQQTFRITATATEGGLGEIAYDVDPETLPKGFFYSCLDSAVNSIPQSCNPLIPEVDARFFDSSGQATGDFTINAPADQLGTSRVVSRVRTIADGDVEDQRGWHDAITNLATRYGVSLSVRETPTVSLKEEGGGFMIIRPGPSVANTFTLLVTNTGLTPASVKLGNSPLPAGWTIAPSADGKDISRGAPLRVQPFETAEFQVTVQSPATLVGGNEATILFFAEVLEDASRRAQFPMTLKVGTFKVDVETARDHLDVRAVAPLEDAPFALEVFNKGNVQDTITLTHQLPEAYHDRFHVKYRRGCTNEGGIIDTVTGQLRCTMTIPAGQFRLVEFDVSVPNRTAPLLEIPMLFTATSDLAQPRVFDETTLKLRILDYVEQDIDGDLIFEMAINRDDDGGNDYEEFRDRGFGITLQSSPLVSFLSDEGIELHTKTDVRTGRDTFSYKLDLNRDGRTDHFLDDNKDGLPDIYWDPYHRWFHRLTVTKDINHDGFREYFVDTDGNCQLDAFYDLVKGQQGLLLRIFVDDDDKVDYVVDRNGNEFADDADIILLGSKGAPKAGEPCDPERGFLGIAQIIERVDMNGDGKLDTVVDTDADGDPDHFIPNGKTNPIAIVLKDVTGDGRADWTYASKGEGNPDSYYDPVTGKSGFIDTRSQFLRELQEYWWVAVLFGFVLLLFVVLVAVTRR